MSTLSFLPHRFLLNLFAYVPVGMVIYHFAPMGGGLETTSGGGSPTFAYHVHCIMIKIAPFIHWVGKGNTE